MSKVFFKQIVLAVIAVVVICFAILKWLNVTTNHNEFIIVPNLKGKSLETVKIELRNHKLDFKLQDSANFNPKYPRFSVIEQSPVAGTKVKENRKIYLIINPSGYRKVAVPNIVKRTFRQAKPTLEALEFKVGKITYIDDIGKDVVLDMSYKDKTLKPGALLPLLSTIDLILGNGKRPSSK